MTCQKGSSSQLWAEAELCLRGFSHTITFSDTGAFLRGLPFNYWYHQFLLGFWCYTDGYRCLSCRKINLSVWNLFRLDLNKTELASNLVEGFFGQGEMISKRLSSETKLKKALLVCFMACTQLNCLVDCFFKCLLQLQFHDLPPNPWLCKAHRGGFHINMCLSIRSRDRKLLKFSQPC